MIQPSESCSPLSLSHFLANSLSGSPYITLKKQEWWTQSKVGRWDGSVWDIKCLSAEVERSTVCVMILKTIVQKFGIKSTFVILNFGPGTENLTKEASPNLLRSKFEWQKLTCTCPANITSNLIGRYRTGFFMIGLFRSYSNRWPFPHKIVLFCYNRSRSHIAHPYVIGIFIYFIRVNKLTHMASQPEATMLVITWYYFVIHTKSIILDYIIFSNTNTPKQNILFHS